MANKDTIDEWQNSYMHMLTKQWHHFQESPVCVTDLNRLNRIQQSLGLPASAQPKGSFQKRIGFAVSERWDTITWRAKIIHWQERVAAGNSDDGLGVSCFNFYSSMKNRLKVAGLYLFPWAWSKFFNCFKFVCSSENGWG